MKTEIESVLPKGYGHWEVICFRHNWSKGLRPCITSTSMWKYTTNDSMLIDDYKSGIKCAEVQLIRKCKEYGHKTILKD